MAPNVGQTPSQCVTPSPCSLARQGWLLDNVYAVREAMTKKLKEVVAIYGLQWASKKIIPRLVNMGTEKAYLARLTTLFAIAVSWRRAPSFSISPH